MKTVRSLSLLGVVVAFLSGCPKHKELSPSSLNDLRRLAVVVRVAGEPLVSLADSSGAVKPIDQKLSSQQDATFGAALRKQVRRKEVQERLREAVLAKLPQTPPWSTSLPAIEVATALETLLIDEGLKPLDYDALAARGADGVLQLEIAEWGLHARQGRPGLYVKGEGKLIKIDGGLVWGASLDFDELADPAAEAQDAVALRDGGFRDAIIGLVGKLSDRIAAQLNPSK
jgi:hypothetical protein